MMLTHITETLRRVQGTQVRARSWSQTLTWLQGLNYAGKIGRASGWRWYLSPVSFYVWDLNGMA